MIRGLPFSPKQRERKKERKLMSSITILLVLATIIVRASSSCRDFCNSIPIKYPFGVDDGCGAPQYRHMLNCSVTDLFFQTPSGNYKVQAIDYDKKTVVVFDPAMSTCSILQPHHDFVMSDIQNAIIPPAPDTIFALMNCSIDSPVLNHYKDLCFNFSDHSCDELYGACTSFKLFHLSSNSTTPPCCFTRYDTVRYMSMNILDCTHYTSIYNTDNLKGVGPLDWLYGIRLSFSVPDTGCDRCVKSGGTCGFDVETEGMLCLCNAAGGGTNTTRQCAGSLASSKGTSLQPWWYFLVTWAAGNLLFYTFEDRVLNSLGEFH